MTNDACAGARACDDDDEVLNELNEGGNGAAAVRTCTGNQFIQVSKLQHWCVHVPF
jgi:hypothetical protein